MAAIDTFLFKLLDSGGSDLHLPAGSPPLLRIHGMLKRMTHPPLSNQEVSDLMNEIISVEDKERFDRDKNIDFAYETRDKRGERRRFRGNTYLQKNGQNIVLRSIPNVVPSLQDLSLPQALAQLTKFHQGIVIATGPAGCGKTSTCAALINLINEHRTLHIITIEDPIEFIFVNKKSLIHQRQVGIHVDNFMGALKDALREDPDVIYIGELRDLETTQLAITAAETGHLVLSTLHTNNAVRTVDRIIDAFPVEQQPHIRIMLSESLKGVISQVLIPRADGRGRIAALEVLIGTPSIANMIREGRTYQIPSALQTGRTLGMFTMDDSLQVLVERNLISKEDARIRAANPLLFE
jgi:twitching motility protein PilT